MSDDPFASTLHIPRPTALREVISAARRDAERVGMDRRTTDEWLSIRILAAFGERDGNYTCPTACVEANHPGREHDEWVRRDGGEATA